MAGKEYDRIDSVRVYNKECIGCQRHGAAVMLSLTEPLPEEGVLFIDVFLNTKQALDLQAELGRRLEENKHIEDTQAELNRRSKTS